MKKTVKIMGYLSLGIVFLLLLLILLISSGILNPTVTSILNKVASKQINGTLIVESIEGNLWKNFTLKNIQIVEDDKPILTINSLGIKYDIFELKQKKIAIEYLHLNHTQLSLIETKDSVWNIQKLIAIEESQTEDSASFSFKLEIEDIQINDFEVSIAPLDTALGIPENMKLNTALYLAFENNNLLFNLQHFNMETQSPVFHIQKMIFTAELSDSILNWSHFELQLPNSNIVSSGSLPFDKPILAKVNMNASPLDFTDFELWLPTIVGRPEINIQIANHSGRSNIDFDLRQEEQKLNIHGLIDDLDIPKYQFLLETDSVNMAYWTQKPEFKSNIKGKVEIKGEGFNLKENSLNLEAHFTDVKYKNHNPENVTISFTKSKENVEAQLKSSTMMGSLNSSIHVSDIFEIPIYDAHIVLSHVDLGRLTSDKRLASDLNVELTAKGVGLELGKMMADIHLTSNHSFLFGEPINDMYANISISENTYSIKDLVFESSFLSAYIGGQGNLSDNNSLDFKINSKNIAPVLTNFGLSPFHFVGGINGNISGPLNAMAFNSDIIIEEFSKDSLSLSNATANIKTRFSLDPNDQLINNSNGILPLSELRVQNVNINTSGQIGAFSFRSYVFDNIEFEMDKQREAIKGNMASDGHFGYIETQFWADHVFSIPQYSLNASLKNIDLAQLTNNDSLYSDLNVEIIAQGKGINPDSINIVVEIKSNESEIFGESIEDFDSRIIYNKGYYRFEKLRFATPFLSAQITGEGEVSTNNNIEFYLKTKDLEKLNSKLKPINLRFNGEIIGKLAGTSDSLNVSSTIHIEHFQLDSIRIEKVFAEASLQKRNSNYSGKMNLQLEDSEIQDLEFEKVQFLSEFTQNKAVNSFTYFSSDSLHGKVLTEVTYSDDPVIYFKEIALKFHNSLWEGGGLHSFIRFGKDSIEIREMNMSSDKSEFKADGIFAFQGTEDLHIKVRDLDLSGIKSFYPFPYRLSGNISGNIDVRGTADCPIIEGGIHIINPVIDTFNLKQISTTYHYSNEKFRLNAYVDDEISRLINANLEIPYLLSFSEPIVMPSPETPVELSVAVNGLDLSRMNSLVPQIEARFKGYLSADLNLKNTISNPKISGNLAINKGGFVYNKLGMYYKDIEFNCHLNNNQIKLDSLNIYSNKGDLRLYGLAEIDSLFQGDLEYLDFHLTGKNFKMFDSEMATAVINTNFNLKGTPENPLFDGQLSLLRTSFNVDMFMKEFDKVYDNSEEPMLITARNSSKVSALKTDITKNTSRKAPPDIYKNLKGQFDIIIPRNFWVKGKNMNFELAGNIKVIKDVNILDLFGSLNVKRGYYKLYGRQLNFEEGSLSFTGGTSINPIVDFKTIYNFRDPDKVLRKLRINIKGRLMEPELAFYIDDAVIEEKDAISYLIFNKGVHQLDNGESNTVQNTNVNFALGQLSNVVKGALQSRIGLDVIEIKGNDGWTQSTISTGKYITNNLFLNYERTFAIDKKDKVIEPDKITLEYQFYRSLFLQATNQNTNSGFDFVIKWTWK